MTIYTERSAEYAGRQTSPILIAVAWLVVGVPLAWGISQTVIKSMPLFRDAPAAATATKPA